MAIAALAALIAPIAVISEIADKRKGKDRAKYGRVASAALQAHGAKMRKLVPVLYQRLGKKRLARLTVDDPFPSWSSIVAAAPARIEDEVATVDEFEAAETIDRYSQHDDSSTRRLRGLLLKLDLFDRDAKRIDPELNEAIEKFLAALDTEIDEADLARAEPSVGEPRPSTRVLIEMDRVLQDDS